MRVYEPIDRMVADGCLTASEARLVRKAEEAGSTGHTLGYETEVLTSAAGDTPRLSGDIRLARQLARRHVGPLGYGVGEDGIYELQSPAARHPLTLALATYAITRMGFLPNGTTGLITAHVSVGSPNAIPYEPETAPERLEDSYRQHSRIVRMVRVVEFMGHTTASRLMAPVRAVEAGRHTRGWIAWNYRGVGGVDITQTAGKDGWNDSNRVEMRTFGFYSPDQFGKLLTVVYYLSRGLFAAPDSSLAHIYGDFEDWVKNYFQDHHLPEFTATDAGKREKNGSTNIADLDGYLRAYAYHHTHGDRSALISRSVEAVDNLTEELGMQGLRLPPFVDNGPSRG